MNIEKEKKITLNGNDYLRIKDIVDWDEKFVQINFYYDDIERKISNSNNTVRIRGIGNKLYLQLKIKDKKSVDGNLSTEYEKEIKFIPYSIKREEILKLSENALDVKDVFLSGFMFTERTIKKIDDNISLFLDKNSFLSINDYEMEIEYLFDSDLLKIDNELKKLEINPQVSLAGKSSRFYKRYYSL